MNERKSYDGEPMMIREPAKGIDMERLCFLRWLIEHGRMEHLPAGPPSGDLALLPSEQEAAGELDGPASTIAA